MTTGRINQVCALPNAAAPKVAAPSSQKPPEEGNGARQPETPKGTATGKDTTFVTHARVHVTPGKQMLGQV